MSHKTYSYPYRPKTKGQKRYFDALNDRSLNYIFVSGPAGTGKSLLAMQKAAGDLLEGAVNKIYLSTSVTPVAGEEIGFLPGDVKEKMASWMLPMTDHLIKFLPDCVKDPRIEFVPLAQIRGRSIDNSILILDEAQNCSKAVIKAVMTRISDDSRLFMMGDFSQSDIGRHTDFEAACDVLHGMNGFKHVVLEEDDIVRSKNISEINRRLDLLDKPIRNGYARFS